MNNQQIRYHYPLLLEGVGLAVLVQLFPIFWRVVIRAVRLVFAMIKTLGKILAALALPAAGILFLYWLLQPKRKSSPLPATESEQDMRAARGYAAIFDVPEQKAAPAPIPADDLKLINGIGPVISRLLEQNGIRTFTELSQAKPDKLSQILETAGLKRLANPASWPEQARLAAAGDWEAFEYYQNKLKSDRKN